MGLRIYYILRSATLTLSISSVLIVVLDIPLSALLQRLVVLLNAAKRYARVQLLRRQRVPVSSCLAFHRERVLKHLPLSSLFLLSLGLTSTSVGIIDDLNRGVAVGRCVHRSLSHHHISTCPYANLCGLTFYQTFLDRNFHI